jgi:hypothetical protein
MSPYNSAKAASRCQDNERSGEARITHGSGGVPSPKNLQFPLFYEM